MPHSPTPEQAAIIEAISERSDTSLICPAYAGCAKTTTMEMASQVAPEPHALGVAFNKRIADELKTRFPQKFEVKTLNGLGHGAFGRAIGKRLELDAGKVGKTITRLAKEHSLTLSPDDWQTIRQLVTKAQISGLVPSTSPQATRLMSDTPESWISLCEDLWIEPTENTLAFARMVLIELIRMSFQGVISFDDQIYMSALFGGQFPRFPLVFVDEAQDLSPLNHLMLRKVSSGRMLVVGDPKQAIYAFRGADHESMDKLQGLRASWQSLPLRTTFRCPRAIVTRQQHHAPGFTAAGPAPQGSVLTWPFDAREPSPEGQWNWSRIREVLAALPQLHPSVAILCRNNAPLLSIAFKLIREGVPITMLGRDLGKALVALSRKIIPDDATPVTGCLGRIVEWAESELAKAEATGQREEKLDSISDRAECLKAVCDAQGVSTAADLRRALAALFESTGGVVTLATGHRAKGLEWDLVLHLDPWRVPSRQAKRQAADGDTRALQQELNLLYVIETRTKHTLLHANLDGFTTGA